MPDPMIAAARELIVDSFDVMRRSVADMTTEALDWEPAGPDTNSISVLVTHSLSATRLLLSIALGTQEPDRDRDAEFETRGLSADQLLAMIDDIGNECLDLLDRAQPSIDWGTERARTSSQAAYSAAYWLLHAVDHLRGHADETSLTRHVWTTSH